MKLTSRGFREFLFATAVNVRPSIDAIVDANHNKAIERIYDRRAMFMCLTREQRFQYTRSTLTSSLDFIYIQKGNEREKIFF